MSRLLLGLTTVVPLLYDTGAGANQVSIFAVNNWSCSSSLLLSGFACGRGYHQSCPGTGRHTSIGTELDGARLHCLSR